MFDLEECLSFSSKQRYSLIKLVKIGNFNNDVKLIYSKDGKNWRKYEFGKILSIGSDLKLFFKSLTPVDSFSISPSKYYQFVIKGKTEASGNIMSLLGDSTSTISNSYCFYKLFADCLDLIIPPDLLAKQTSEYCYSKMFFNCSNLIRKPKIEESNCAYRYDYKMFDQCSCINHKSINTPIQRFSLSTGKKVNALRNYIRNKTYTIDDSSFELIKSYLIIYKPKKSLNLGVGKTSLLFESLELKCYNIEQNKKFLDRFLKKYSFLNKDFYFYKNLTNRNASEVRYSKFKEYLLEDNKKFDCIVIDGPELEKKGLKTDILNNIDILNDEFIIFFCNINEKNNMKSAKILANKLNCSLLVRSNLGIIADRYYIF